MNTRSMSKAIQGVSKIMLNGEIYNSSAHFGKIWAEITKDKKI